MHPSFRVTIKDSSQKRSETKRWSHNSLRLSLLASILFSYFLFFFNGLTGLHVHVRRRGTAARGSYGDAGVLRLGVTKMIRLVVLCFLLSYFIFHYSNSHSSHATHQLSSLHATDVRFATYDLNVCPAIRSDGRVGDNIICVSEIPSNTAFSPSATWHL